MSAWLMLAEAVTWGCRVLSVEDTGETAVARLGDGSVIRARWVIGADGAHSVVRKSAEIGFPGVQMIELHFLADVHADLDTPRDAVAFWASPVGVMGAFPLPGDNNAWRLMAPAADPDRSDPAPRDILAELEAGLAPLRRHHSLGRVGVVVSDTPPTRRLLPPRQTTAGRGRRTHPQPRGRPGG